MVWEAGCGGVHESLDVEAQCAPEGLAALSLGLYSPSASGVVQLLSQISRKKRTGAGPAPVDEPVRRNSAADCGMSGILWAF